MDWFRSRLNSFGKWFWPMLSTLIVGFLTGIVTVATTAFGASMVDWLNDDVLRDPTEAIVSGNVVRGDEGIEGVTVILSSNFTTLETDLTDSEGRFEFNDVGEGSYDLPVWARDQFLGVKTVTIADNGESQDVGNIEVSSDFVYIADVERCGGSFPDYGSPPNLLNATPDASSASQAAEQSLRLAYHAEPTPFRGVFGMTEFQSVDVIVTGSEEELAFVERVEYFLHPYFAPQSVSKFPEDALRLQFDTCQEFTLYARVFFHDGRVADLQKRIEF